MRNIGVLALFLASILCVTWSLKADASAAVRIVPSSELSAPVPFEVDGKKKNHRDGGEESEEDFAPGAPSELTPIEALQQLDPGVLDQMMRLRSAAAHAGQ